MSDPGPPEDRRRVRRGEGEVRDWPRGLVDYVPVGPDAPSRDPEEDRLIQRLKLAGRLIDLVRAHDPALEAEVAELRSAEAARARGDRAAAEAILNRLLATLDRRAAPRPERPGS